MNIIEKARNIKWTRKKYLYIFFSIALIAILTYFLSGNDKGYQYIEATQNDYSEKIVAVGQLGMKNQNMIIAEVSGRIENIAGEGGDTIENGEALISILNNDYEASLKQSQAAYLDAKGQYDLLLEYDYLTARQDLERDSLLKGKAEKNFKDAQILFDEGAISENLLLDYKAALLTAESQWKNSKLKYDSLSPGGARRDSTYYKMENAKSFYDKSVADESKYIITAEWDAVILNTMVSKGDTVKPGDLLMEIGENNKYVVSAELDEKYYLYVSKGMEVSIKGDGPDGGNSLKGKVSVVNPKINENTGTFEIQIEVVSEIGYIASDLTVNIEILLKEKENVIVIPKNYLINGEPYLYIYKNGKAKKSEVQVEFDSSSNIFVQKGVESGDIILLPTDQLSDGKIVKLGKGVDPS